MKRSNPEARLQIQVKKYLGWCLPSDILWSASLTGTYLTPQAAARAKAMGVRRGIPDLVFLFPDGTTRWIELKAVKGSLSEEQREFRQHCLNARPDIWALCRTLDEVEATLRGWGAEMKATTYFGAELSEDAA